MQHDSPGRFGTTRNTRIVVDDRERDPRVRRALQARPDVLLSIERLEIGDYVVDAGLVVERKTLPDFAMSVRDGRLFSQIGRLARQRTFRPCLILEGASSCRLAVPPRALRGALVSVTLVFGLPVLRSPNPEATADLILCAARQLRRRASRPPRRRSLGRNPLRDQQLWLLQSIPGVGPERASALLDRFGSPGSVALATPDELVNSAGIGPETARTVIRLFRGDPRSHA